MNTWKMLAGQEPSEDDIVQKLFEQFSGDDMEQENIPAGTAEPAESPDRNPQGETPTVFKKESKMLRPGSIEYIRQRQQQMEDHPFGSEQPGFPERVGNIRGEQADKQQRPGRGPGPLERKLKYK